MDANCKCAWCLTKVHDFADTDHTEFEDRSRTYGMSNKARLLEVVYAERRNSIRIISARKATRYEKSIYKNG
ncbi:hypothetical protein B0E49_08385 [Polaromonas sp. C04]|nr:hypothetical protein B0E49_08385 [Polaromonas sp. C04]